MDNNLISVDYGADLASSILGFVFFFFLLVKYRSAFYCISYSATA